VRSATIRRATEADIQTVADLWNESSEWLRGAGLDQWQYPVRFPGIRAAVHSETCWIVEDPPGEPVGTVTLDDDADPELWTPLDKPGQALYLHRLVVRSKLRGRDLGSAIVDWASVRAQSLGKAWLRLDAWTTNDQLHRYYLDRGFRLVRIVPGASSGSGAAFEREAGKVLGRGPLVAEVRDGGARE